MPIKTHPVYTIDAAGWNYPSPGICEDNAGTRYPWHAEFVQAGDGPSPRALGYCQRCGERRPDPQGCIKTQTS